MLVLVLLVPAERYGPKRMAFSVRQYRKQLFEALERVPPALRPAFAAACAERLLPRFVQVSEEARRGDAALLSEALDQVWTWAATGKRDEVTARRLIPKLEANVFEDGLTHEWAFAADDAAAATTYAMMATASQKAQDAGWAAMRILDALDTFLQAKLFPNGGKISADRLEQMAQQPIYQAELDRQRRDLERLAATSGDPSDIVATLKSDAKLAAPTVFGEASR